MYWFSFAACTICFGVYCAFNVKFFIGRRVENQNNLYRKKWNSTPFYFLLSIVFDWTNLYSKFAHQKVLSAYFEYKLVQSKTIDKRK